MKESPESLPGSVLLDFKQHLGSILSRVERRKAQLDVLTTLHEFYDSVSIKKAGLYSGKSYVTVYICILGFSIFLNAKWFTVP